MSYKIKSIIALFIFLLTCNLTFSQTIDNSRFLKQSIPSTMAAGEKYQAVITFMNNGTTIWLPKEYTLQMLNSDGSTTNGWWGVTEMDLKVGVAAGQSISFEIPLIAPSNQGTYVIQTQMKHNGNYFGETSTAVQVIVGPVTSTNNDFNSAAFVDQSVSSSMKVDAKYKVSVTMTNSGKVAWTPGDYRLVNLDTRSSTMTSSSVWGVSSVDLDETIAPGSTKVFIFTVVAPSTPGNYLFQWRMSGPGGLFGDASRSVDVNVVARRAAR